MDGYDVTIVCGEKTLAMIENVCKDSDFLPTKSRVGKYWFLEWWDVRWLNSLPEVAAIEEVLEKLETAPSYDASRAFKQFIYDNSNECFSINMNDAGALHLSDFFAIGAVAYPGLGQRQAIDQLLFFTAQFIRDNWRNGAEARRRMGAMLMTLCLFSKTYAGSEKYVELLGQVYVMSGLEKVGVTVDEFKAVITGYIVL